MGPPQDLCGIKTSRKISDRETSIVYLTFIKTAYLFGKLTSSGVKIKLDRTWSGTFAHFWTMVSLVPDFLPWKTRQFSALNYSSIVFGSPLIRSSKSNLLNWNLFFPEFFVNDIWCYSSHIGGRYCTDYRSIKKRLNRNMCHFVSLSITESGVAAAFNQWSWMRFLLMFPLSLRTNIMK